MEDFMMNDLEDKPMLLSRIKYFTAKCPKCKKEYEVKLELLKHQVYCYKCAIKLRIPEIDIQRVESVNRLINAANTAIETLSIEYKVSRDDDGLIINPLPLPQEPIFAQS